MVRKRRTHGGTKTRPKRKSPVKRKPASRAKTLRGKKTTARKSPGSKTRRTRKSPVKRKPASRAKTRRGKKTTARKSAGRKTKRAATSRRPARFLGSDVLTGSTPRGLGPEAAGQAGDTEGLSQAELADSESVEELVEEGQAFEAGIVSGVENAPDADRGGVRTRQVPEDDVPQEYLDED